MKKGKKEILPIFFAIDDYYIPFFSVALKSIVENASEKYGAWWKMKYVKY